MYLYHFVFLNHFRHNVKIYIYIYLYSSLKNSINGVRDHIISNPPLHDGLMLLIYEDIKANSVGKFLKTKEAEVEVDDFEEDGDYMKMEDVDGLHFDKDSVTIKGKRKKSKGKDHKAHL